MDTRPRAKKYQIPIKSGDKPEPRLSDYIRRGQIPSGTAPFPQGVLSRLKQLDPAIELIFANGKWGMYIIKRPGATPSDDLLVKQDTPLDDGTPPGSWLIDWVQKCIQARVSAREWVRQAMERKAERERKHAKKVSDLKKDIARDYDAFVIGGRKSILVDGVKDDSKRTD